MQVGNPPPILSSIISVEQSVGQRFIDLYVVHFQSLIEESHRRVEQCKNVKEGEPIPRGLNQLLGQGVWYATDYYMALKKFKQSECLTSMENNGTFFHGLAPKDAVTSVTDPSSLSGRRLFTFRVKKGCSATQALESLEKGLSIIDCYTVIELAAYHALKELMPEKFDLLFAADSPTPFCIGLEKNMSPIMRLFKRKEIAAEKDIQKGDKFHVSNIQTYIHKSPAGNARGFNLVCKTTECAKRYLGFGLNSTGVDVEDVEKALWEDYNAKPILEGFYSPELWKRMFSTYILQDEKRSREFVFANKDKQLTWEQFQQEPVRNIHRLTKKKGKLLLEVFRPSLKRIERLAQATSANACQVLASFGS